MINRNNILLTFVASSFYLMKSLADINRSGKRTKQSNDAKICCTISKTIEYFDLDYLEIYEETKTVQSSEKFQKLVDSYKESQTIGGGVDLGLNVFSLGLNAEVTNAWEKSTEKSMMNKAYYEFEEKKKIVFKEGSRQLFKETTIEMKVEIIRGESSSRSETSTAKSVERIYKQSVNIEKCPYPKDDKLVKAAQRDIRQEAQGKNDVSITGIENRTLTETKCGIEGRLKRYKIV